MLVLVMWLLENFVPSFSQLGPIQSLGQTFPALGIPKFTPPQITNTAVTSAVAPSIDQAALSNSFFVPQTAAQSAAVTSGANTANVVNTTQDTGGVRSIFDKLFRRPKVMTDKATGIQRVVTMPDGKTPVMEFSPGKVASALALTAFGSGAFDPKPVDVYTPTYNLAVAELQKEEVDLNILILKVAKKKRSINHLFLKQIEILILRWVLMN